MNESIEDLISDLYKNYGKRSNVSEPLGIVFLLAL